MAPFWNVFCKALIIVFALIGLLFTGVFLAMQFDLLNVRGGIDSRNEFFGTPETSKPCITEEITCAWNQSPEWIVVREGLTKDENIIKRVAEETGVEARLIASVVIPEQIRFFTSEREVFKRYFEPLKILGSLSQFSLGVTGIKQETAEEIERYANDSTSPFYPGKDSARLIAYTGERSRDELFKRLTDEKDHYYSYLYTALFLKEVETQWGKAGFSLENKPEILITLFNLGFEKSVPNANPQVGGASVEVGGTIYSFGELGSLFYNSNELANIFPR